MMGNDCVPCRQLKKGVSTLDELVKMFREAEAKKFKTFTYTQVLPVCHCDQHVFAVTTSTIQHLIIFVVFLGCWYQHVNREIKFEEKLLEEVVRQTELFKISNGTDSEEKKERLRQMSEEAQRYGAAQAAPFGNLNSGTCR